MNLIALKPVRYPRGPEGKNYQPGEAFTVRLEKHAKALTLTGLAKRDESPSRRYQTKVQSIEQSTAQSEPTSELEAPRRYRRRDMTSEG